MTIEYKKCHKNDYYILGIYIYIYEPKQIKRKQFIIAYMRLPKYDSLG